MASPLSLLRIPLRLLGLATLTIYHTLWIIFGSRLSPDNLRRWGSRMSRLVGLQLEVIGDLPKQGGLLIANHRSYTDVPVLMALCPSRFLSKAEVQSWPLLGWAATKAGTIFVQREQAESRREARRQLRMLLDEGAYVIVFPEGTTTPQGTLTSLRPGMFREAVEARLPITLAAIEYERADAAWTLDESFLVHFMRAFRLRRQRVKVSFSDPIWAVEGEEPEALQERCERWLREQINSLSGREGLAPEPTELFDARA